VLGKAEGLQQRELGSAAPHRGGNGQAEGDGGADGESRREQDRYGADRLVVLDLGRLLNGNYLDARPARPGILREDCDCLVGRAGNVLQRRQACSGRHAGAQPDEGRLRAIERRVGAVQELPESGRLDLDGDDRPVPMEVCRVWEFPMAVSVAVPAITRWVGGT
jgi:hypothetical protein